MSTSSEESCVNTMGIHGFPENCGCGRATRIYTSSSKQNPGRPFFRCPTFEKGHLFKWVEDAVYEEVHEALPKVECLESAIVKSKIDIEGIKSGIEELMEDVKKTKIELKRTKMLMKLGFGSMGFVIMFCLARKMA